MDHRFSVAMSIYKNDVAEDLKTAVNSIINQTLQPAEIVILGDGSLPEDILQVMEELKEEARNAGTEIIFLPQEHNRGLGAALQIVVNHCKYPYIARMDADDIALPDRFEKEMKCFEEDPDLSIVGGMITEFVDSPDNIVTRRTLPLTDKEIKKFMRSRCGLNHMTVIFKKEDILKAGNYNNELRQEDYYLWARMMKAGCTFRNIPDVVVNVRSGKDQFSRRGGLSYYKNHCAVFNYMYREGLISLPRLLYNYVVRGIVQFALPNNVRTWVYQTFLRK